MEETISPAKDEGAQINSYFVSDAIDHHHMECVKEGCVVVQRLLNRRTSQLNLGCTTG